LNKFDVVVIGGGPGGYVAAIRASQLGKKVALVEKDKLGGICLNWGCIPTKALLKNADVLNLIKKASSYGIDIDNYTINWPKVIKRSRNISTRLSKGIEFLMKKNKVEVFNGVASFINKESITVKNEDKIETIKSDFFIISTGARAKDFPSIKTDGKHILSYKEAMILDEIPKTLTIIGAGAIGVEFAHIYKTFGTDVTIVESLPNLLPVEDREISEELEKQYRKKNISILTGTKVNSIKVSKNMVETNLENGKVIKSEKVLIAIGVRPNIEDLNLEICNIKLDNGWIKVSETMQTNVENIYAIGDVAGPPWLAHVASKEGINAVEHLSSLNPLPIDYKNVPGCTYCDPEVASVGYSENEAKKQGYEVRVGKFPFRALGKSLATGNHEGFVKMVYDVKYGELLGCHIIGPEATNLISEAAIAINLETTYREVLNTIHPHPTLSEAIMEATADAYDEAIHI
tara:strand:- start:22814 stop:24193 length:1380 start_codon:yes stop_codon:yes gene_type:complete